MKKVDDIVNFIRTKDYTVVNPDLGAGSLGETVLLKDEQLDDMLLVAKKYKPQKESDKQKFYTNFVEEVKILLTLNHRNIVRIYDWWLYPEWFTGIITMEYIDGCDLRYYFKKYKPQYFTVGLNDIFRQIIDAFCYIEKSNIIHRDIRESNILVTKDGTVKIIDFGLGKIVEKKERHVLNSLSGEINHSSVELFPEEEYNGEYTTRTDMFYIAELFFRLLHETQKEQFFTYSEVLKKMKMCDPDKRYQSFDEIKQAVSAVDFSNLRSDAYSKKVYQNFVTPLERAIDAFLREPEFCDNPDALVATLDDVLKNNILEDDVQRVDDVIIGVVKTGFRLNKRSPSPMAVEAVREFCHWFKTLSLNDQKLILGNMAHRLSKIKVEKRIDDIPF